MLWLDPERRARRAGAPCGEPGDAKDAAADAEPGKILHEARHGEMADLGEVPFRRYYGSVDATPALRHARRRVSRPHGRRRALPALWPNIEAALEWIETLSATGTATASSSTAVARSQGLANQGWKDSHDAIFHADGSLAKGPIALVEVQAYVYAAWRAAERITHGLAGGTNRARLPAPRQRRSARAFDAHFFDEELGTYVLALDGDKKPCRVRASNAGHALFAGIALPERADRRSRKR